MSDPVSVPARRTVLILCTGNSCRSQMAEALINHNLGDLWTAVSAGTEPASEVHPLTHRALAEIGIAHAGRPKHVSEFAELPLDLVLTVCDDAAENCPVWLGGGRKHHISFRDPAKAVGTLDERMAVFRMVRDDIARRLLEYLAAQA